MEEVVAIIQRSRLYAYYHVTGVVACQWDASPQNRSIAQGRLVPIVYIVNIV